MWTAYKKEIIAQEKQGRKDYLKNFYHKNKLSSSDAGKKDLNINGDASKVDATEGPQSGISSQKSSLREEPSLSIVYDSDEEPSPLAQKTKEKENLQNKTVRISLINIRGLILIFKIVIEQRVEML